MRTYFVYLRVIIFTILISNVLITYSQVLNTARVNIGSNSFMNCPGNVINNSTGIINNNGTMIIGGNIVNNAIINSAFNSNVKLTGGAQYIGGTNSTTFSDLFIDGTDNKTISIHTYIDDSLKFNANKIINGNNDLYLLQNAKIYSSSSSKYIVTNGTGSVIKKSLPLVLDFVFPVGFTTSNYNPVTLNYTGTVDTFAVRVSGGILPATGADNTCVQYTYIIQESNNSGTNASLNLAWNTSDEGTLFFSPQSLIWQNDNGTWNSLGGTPGATANAPATDWYHQTSGITDFSANASHFIVRSFSPPVITVQPEDINICAGTDSSFSITATGEGVLTYQWQVNCGSGWSDVTNGSNYTGSNTSTLNTVNAAVGMNNCQYQCIVSNAAGSDTSNTAALTVIPLPVADAGTDAVICANSIFTVNTATASNYTTLNWLTSGTGTFTNNNTLTPSYTPSTSDTTAGYVALTLVAYSLCGNDSDSMVLNFTSLPTANAGNDVTICAGSDTTLSATGGTGYQWAPSTGLSATNISNPLASPGSTITYYVTVTSSCGNATDSVTVAVVPLPLANAGTDQLFLFVTTTSLAANNPFPDTGVWSIASGTGGNIADINNPNSSFNGLPYHTYILVWTVSNSCGSSSDTVIISFDCVPILVDLGNDTAICEGQTLVLDAGNPGSAYSWTGGYTTQKINVTQAGTYSVTVTDINGCTGIDSINVTVNPLPVANAGADQSICIGDTVVLTATGGLYYQWNNSVINGVPFVPGATATYSVTVTDNNNCSSSDEVTVTLNQPPSVFAGNDTTICGNDNFALISSHASNYISLNWTTTGSGHFSNNTDLHPVYYPGNSDIYGNVTLTLNVVSNCGIVSDNLILSFYPVIVINAGADVTILAGADVILSASGGTNYSWTPDYNISCTNCQNPVVWPRQTTSYIVTGADIHGCASSDTIVVTVNSENSIFIPSAFSPNGDYENEVMYVRGKCIEELEFIIYDRWGEKVFYSNSLNDGWDGSFKGKKMNPAVFVYYAKIKFYDGSWVEKKGNITLVY
ncbi:MAG: gliding motility-associated C-terminal domain-containing protein [Bacteroidia bacterium]|nr:gliding motility-associated C-terminal domain-containing protein [Bacteroidia bacterium]